MRYIELHEETKVPILKNLRFAFKMVMKADKRLFWGIFICRLIGDLCTYFLQNVLLLKVLLSILDRNAPFREYAWAVAGLGALIIISSVVYFTARGYESIATKRALKYFNNKIFEKALSLDVSCYENPEFYDKYQRATLIPSRGYYELLCWNISSVFADAVTLVIVAWAIIATEPVYLLFLLPAALVFAVELKKGKSVYKRDFAMTKNNRMKSYIQRTVFLKDYAKDMRTSNIFSVLTVRFKSAMEDNVKILKEYGVRLFLYSVVSWLFNEFIPIVGSYAFAAYQLIYKSALSVTGFSVVLSSVTAIKDCTFSLVGNIREMSETALYFDNLRTFFEYEAQITDGEKEPGDFESLEFKNVSFSYPHSEKKAIDSLSFKITKGEKLAVVGVNGAGKTTLVKLILRFYDPDEGEILYNGINIKEYRLEKYRLSFGTVFQDYKNFAVTVYENIVCRVADSGDCERADRAMKLSGIYDKVQKLPNGGETVLTKEFDENGAGLSGGENQKLSAARLFASDFLFAILDEPSSALDPVAENHLYNGLTEATKGKSVLYISHRLSSAVLSDRILVISNGRLIQCGTHSELMAVEGEYSKMFNLQASSYQSERGGENGKD